jgi:alpha-1,6-mannosyltransferase
MHIADITMFYAPESGGVKRYLHAKGAWLARRPGFRHSILVPGSRHMPHRSGVVPLRSVPLPGGSGYRLPLGGWQARRALRRLRPDVIEAGDPYFYAWAALGAGRDLGAPVVAFCHSDLPGLVGRCLAAPGAQGVKRYIRSLYGRFDLVFAASDVVERGLRDMGLRNVVRQPLGVDTAMFNPGMREAGLRSRLGLPQDTRLLAYAGRYSPEKNLWVLEQAMRSLGSSFALLTIGSGSHPPRAANIVNLPYESDPSALARLLASCDALVHPGDQETFGLVVLEAMACGLPAIVTDAGGAGELIDDTVGIKVPPRRPEALRLAIRRLFRLDRAALSRNARARAVARHDWNAVMPGLITHYHAVRHARALHAATGEAVGQLGKP